MSRFQLVLIAAVIFITFGILMGLKQSKNAMAQANENEYRIADIDGRKDDIDYQIK